ncbi:hypothetical protein B566_EDAN010077 [Ephemera danica]|nr:hypothetical protein B566_EDAN010077 [Ephemera danica]
MQFVVLLLAISASIQVDASKLREIRSDENAAFSQDEQQLCQGMTIEETRICNILARNLQSLVGLSLGPRTQQTICNETNLELNQALDRENALKSELLQTKFQLNFLQHRDIDLVSKLENANKNEVEVRIRYEILQEREKQLISKLDTCSQDVEDVTIEITKLNTTLNFLTNKLNETQVNSISLNLKLEQLTRDKMISETRFLLLNQSYHHFDFKSLHRKLNICEHEILEWHETFVAEIARYNETQSKLEKCQLQNHHLFLIKTNKTQAVLQMLCDYQYSPLIPSLRMWFDSQPTIQPFQHHTNSKTRRGKNKEKKATTPLPLQ